MLFQGSLCGSNSRSFFKLWLVRYAHKLSMFRGKKRAGGRAGSAIWHLAEMQQESSQRDLPLPDEDVAHQRCLRSGAEAPYLTTVEDFLRFYVTTSRPQLSHKPTVDSVNTVTEWFLVGFTRVTRTDTNEQERGEVYDVSCSAYP